MTKQYTNEFKEETGSTQGSEPIYLLEITHPQLATPIRVARDYRISPMEGYTMVGWDFLRETLNAVLGVPGPIVVTRSGNTATRINAQGLIEVVSANTPRFDYDPILKQCIGLLSEETRVNRVFPSDDFSSANWTKRDATISSNAEWGPVGGSNTADRLVQTTGNLSYKGCHFSLLPVTSGDYTTVWMIVKAYGNTRYVSVDFHDLNLTYATVDFDLQAVDGDPIYRNGGTTTSRTVANSAFFRSMGNGYYWLGASFLAGATTNLFPVLCMLDSARNQSSAQYVGSTSNGMIIAAGQVETGRGGTSYIPTVGASVTRNGDQPNLVIGSWYNVSASTFVAEFRGWSGLSGSPSNSRIIGIQGSGTKTPLSYNSGPGPVITTGVWDGTTATNVGSYTTGAVARMATAYTTPNNLSSSLNGAAVVTGSGANFGSPTDIYLGHGGGSLQLNGHLRRALYFPQQLSNTQLPQLSALGEFFDSIMTKNIVSQGNVFIPLAFDVTLPDDVDGQLPRALLRIDNIGREMTQWIDQSSGGKGAKVRLMQIMPDTPDILEYDVTLDLVRVRQNPAHIVGEIGYENTLNLSALPITYRPDNSPGLF